jgi:NitT/TauT family transport system permease protein
MSVPYSLGEPIAISLSPMALPGYAINTVLRMLIALFCSLLFTFIIAPLAAKNRGAEKIILPLIDILESVPVLGYLSITVVAFIQLFPNNLLGPQCAAIFAIFTSQVWNMTLSLYQSLQTVPQDLHDTAAVFHLNAWQKFWRIEVPHAMPSLVWNTMISLSSGWFFVVACEAISVSNQNILLPGIGSYISVAIHKANLPAINYAIITMFLVIVMYDQLAFRPLLTWMERFKSEREDDNAMQSWFYNFLAKSRFFKQKILAPISWTDLFLNPPWLTSILFAHKKSSYKKPTTPKFPSLVILWYAVLWIGICIASSLLFKFITKTINLSEIKHVFYLGALTMLKVAGLIVIASLVWVPIGVWVGLNPKIRRFVQPITQFLAAFPINLIYPVAVTLIVHFNLNVEIWTTPLMILGTQWYILFNVIAGASAIPKELQLAVQNFSLSPWLRWKRLILPAIFPYYVTGAMTAAAGCWNVSIVTEVLAWGDKQLIATGLGSYITQHTTAGDFPRIALGIAVMCGYVVLINRLLWHRLYQYATSRYTLE